MAERRSARSPKVPIPVEDFKGADHWIPEPAPERFNEELLAHLAAHP